MMGSLLLQYENVKNFTENMFQSWLYWVCPQWGHCANE